MAEAGKSQNGLPPPDQPVNWLAFCFSNPNFDRLYGPYRWEPAPPARPTTQQTALNLYAELTGRLPTPTIHTDPPLGTAAIIGVPVFITVTNWQPTYQASANLLGTTVTVTATPTLTYNPAEPDSTPITCNGGGHPYQPGAGTLTTQAANPHTCTHTYQHRTTTPNRPPAWPATATITWTITWHATDGTHGNLPPITRTTPLPRPVHEIQTLITTN